MKRFAAWFWKEWRDQRAVTIGILLAIPGLTALAYVAFGEKIGTANLENVRPVFLAIAVGLVVFAVAGDLFAGENRRKTIFALRRLPGGMRAAFAAKVTYLALLVVAVIAVQGLSLAVAENQNAAQMKAMGISSYHNDGASRSVALYEELARFPKSRTWLTGLGFGVLALWTLLVSSWMGRSGVASIGAVVLLAALAVPFFFFFKQHPWFFPGPMRLAALSAGALGIVAFVATAVSFLRGQRFHGRPFRPFLLGASLLLVCLGGGYAYARVSLADWLEISPTDADFHIYEACYGVGGKHLFLTVHRGAAWYGDGATGEYGGGRDPWASRRGSPLQAWVVDLESGAWRVVDERAMRYFMPVPESDGVAFPRSLDPAEALVSYQPQGAGGDLGNTGIGWWDARSAERLRVLPAKVRDAGALELIRRQLRASTWMRDADGRRVWERDGVVEREGEAFAPVEGVVARSYATRLNPVPGGWYGLRFGEAIQPYARPSKTIAVDAVSGRETELPAPRGSMPWYGRCLSTAHHLRLKLEKDESGAARQVQYVESLAAPGERVRVKNPPAETSSVIGRDLVLALRGERDAYTLHAWNPRTGADTPLVWEGQAGPERIRSCSAYGRTGDGRILLQFRHLVGDTRTEHVGWAVLRPDEARLRLIPTTGYDRGGVVALLADDSLVLVRQRKRVVRHRPDGSMEALFPRK